MFTESAGLFLEIGDLRNLAVLRGNLAEAALLEGDFGAAQALFESAIALAEEAGDRGQLPSYHQGLATAALLGEQYDTAVSHLSIALVDGRQIGDVHALLAALAGIAAIVGRGDPHTAGMLWSAAAAVTRELGIQISGADVLLEPLIAAVAELAGEEDWGRAVERGTQLSLEDAADLAVRALARVRR
jgi:tetratricopeptide (TPR) repeat protein